MVYPASPHFFFELERRIRQRTGWRVRDLVIEVMSDPERAIVHGHATSPMARQIAANVIKDYLATMPVENGITVDDFVDVLPGMPLN